MGYTVEAHIPNNQIDKEKTHFNLLMSPKPEQLIEVTVYNTSDEEITVNITITNAFTNSKGLVIYNELEKELMKV